MWLDLNVAPHLDYIKQQSPTSDRSKIAYVIYKDSHCVDHSCMRTLYWFIVLPSLMYCSEIWGNTYVTNTDMPHDTDYPYPIRILAFLLSDMAVLRFDTDFN